MTARLRDISKTLAAVAVATAVAVAGTPAARATAGTVVADNGSGNGIASGAVARMDPNNALVTVTNRFHFWAALDVSYVAGSDLLRPSPLSEDFGGIYADIGLIGPNSTAAWDGHFTAGSQALVRIHYDLSSAGGAAALAANLLTIIADSLGASLSATSSSRLLSALQLITGMSSWADLVHQAQNNDIWGLVTSIEVLLGSKTGRDTIRQALGDLNVVASDAALVKAASVVGIIDWVYTLFDIYRSVLLGQNDGTVIFSVAPPSAAATPTPTTMLAASPGPTPTGTPRPTPRPIACNVVYASGWQGQGVYQLDTTRGQIAAQTKTSLYNNRYLAWNDVRRELYVVADNGGVISVVDTAALREVATISADVGWNGYSIVVSSDGSTIVATFASGDAGNQSQRVVEFDAASRTARHSVILDQTYGAPYAAISPDGSRVYVSWDNKLDIYDASTMSLLKRITDVTSGSGRLVVSPDGRYLFIVQPGELLKYDLRAGQVVATAQVDTGDGGGISWTSLSRDGSAVWVAGNDRVSRVPLSLEGVTAVQASAPIAFDESTDGTRLFVAFGDGKSVSTIDLATGRTIGSIQVSNATALVAVPCR